MKSQSRMIYLNLSKTFRNTQRFILCVEKLKKKQRYQVKSKYLSLCMLINLEKSTLMLKIYRCDTILFTRILMECIVRIHLGKPCLVCFSGILFLMTLYLVFGRHHFKQLLQILELKIFTFREQVKSKKSCLKLKHTQENKHLQSFLNHMSSIGINTMFLLTGILLNSTSEGLQRQVLFLEAFDWLAS